MCQSETYPDNDAFGELAKEPGAISPPSKEDLVEMLRRSHRVWLIVTQDNSAAKKAADILGIMLKKIEQSGRIGEGSPIPTWQRQMAIGSAEPISGPSPHGALSPFLLTRPRGYIVDDPFVVQPQAGHLHPVTQSRLKQYMGKL